MRSPTVVGIVAGMVVVVLVAAAAFVALPFVVPDASAAPSVAPGTAPSVAPSTAPSVSPSTAPLISPSQTTTPASQGAFSSPSAAQSSPASPPGTALPSAAGVGLRVGQTAPPLALPLLGGGTTDLSAYRGRPLWVTFLASWCPACQDELPLMEAYHAQLGDQLPILLVDVREDAATSAALAKSFKLDLPIGLDTGGGAQRSWGAYALPIHYWIDASGVVRAVGYGGLAPPQFKASIQTVLPGAVLKP